MAYGPTIIYFHHFQFLQGLVCMKQDGTITLIVLNRIKAIAIQHEKARSWKVGDGCASPHVKALQNIQQTQAFQAATIHY
jgi:hypothetical protein